MAYSELIKNFEKVRSYMRDFYVYGFKGRDEFNAKSARIYDDEYRRVKGWLEGYMDSYYDESGKKVFISIDSRTLSRNENDIARIAQYAARLEERLRRLEEERGEPPSGGSPGA